MPYLFKIIIFYCILFAFMQANAQENKESALKISYANDLFTGTDQYFTQGIRIELINDIFRRTPIRFISFFPANETIPFYSIAIQQDGFTPTSIRHDTVLKGDRPFCGSIFLTNSQYVQSEKTKTLFHTQLDLGAIGPIALGYEEQTLIHKTINNILPKGWRNEIQNDLILNYTLDAQQTLINKKYTDVATTAQIRVGTMFTDLSAGAQVRIGIKKHWLHSAIIPLTKRLQLYGFAKSQVRAAAYNATLQGGLLNRSSVYTIPGSELRRVLVQAEIGFTASYKNIVAQYSQSYTSKDFKTGQPHAWGRISLMAGF